MARLQIVTLPSLTVGAVSQPEYLIVLDEVGDALEADLIRDSGAWVKVATGARGVLAFQSRVEVIQ